MKKKAPLEKLSEIFNTIRDTALEVHEHFEHEGNNPFIEFEQCVLGNGRRFDDETRASSVWSMLLFTQPRLVSQKKFQTAVSAKLPNAEASLIVRHLMCTPPRAWSFRHSYQRGFAHTLAGPNAHSEISVDGCLSTWGTVQEDDHLYVIGWTLPFEDNIFLICANEINQQQVYQVEKIRPFPLQLSEDDFWEENMLELMQELYALLPQMAVSNQPELERTDYSPERRFDRLGRIISNTLSSNVVRAASSLQTVVASSSPMEILASVDSLVSSAVHLTKEQHFLQELRLRTLEAVGCDSDGNMPHAHVSFLTSDPIALLLLPESLEMFKEISPRDSIRMALAYDEKHGSDYAISAFKIYQRERRWLAAFPCFDFSCEDHASRFGIPVEAIETIFSPELFKAKLPIIPQGEVLRQLQNKYGFYQPNTPNPSFRMVIDAINSRAFQRAGNMAAIVQWIMSCCERWRYCLCEIEPDTSTRTINQSNQQLLQKGLKGLSAMFKK